jgi:hypothetical protein
VSGVVALMISANHRLTTDDVKDVMCDTAVRMDLDGGEWDEAGWSPLYGCGRIDAGAAVRAVENIGPPDIAVDTTGEELLVGEVVLSWTAAPDPDNDRLAYTVKWWDAEHPGKDEKVVTERTWLDLNDQVVAGQWIQYKVRAADVWGNGEWTEPVLIAIVDPPVVEETGGCQTAPGAPLWTGWLLVLGLARRRSAL